MPPTTSSTASSNLPLSYPTLEVLRVVDDCRAVARGIADDLARRTSAAAVAQAGWAGSHRRSFDRTYTTCVAQLGELHDHLLKLAAALQADQTAADHENKRRAARRAEADAEHRRQERAAAPAAAAP